MMGEDKEPETPKGVKIDLKGFKIPKLKSNKIAAVFGGIITAVIIIAVIITFFNVGMKISGSAAEEKAADYITGNFLAAQGLSAEATGSTDRGSYYEVSVDIMQDGSKQESTLVYVSKDGESLILGQVFNLNEAPEILTGAATSEQVKQEYTTQDLEKISQFVDCLSTKGVKIYGANWCGWTKKLVVDTLGGFDIAAPIYVECTEQELICEQEEIKGFPTIKINGEVYEGQRTFEGLAEATGCEAPDLEREVVVSSSDSSC